MPLLQADAAGDIAYLAYDTTPGPIALWNSATPNIFSVSAANDSATDVATSADGTSFILRANNTTEIRAANLSLVSAPTQSELETIPNRVAVPGIALYPTGALIYEPFLDGPQLPLYPPPEFMAALTDVTRTRASFVSVSISPSLSPCSLRGSGFVSGITATLGGKQTTVSFQDTNTLIPTTPLLSARPQQLVLTNPDGETISLDAAFLSQ